MTVAPWIWTQTYKLINACNFGLEYVAYSRICNWFIVFRTIRNNELPGERFIFIQIAMVYFRRDIWCILVLEGSCGTAWPDLASPRAQVFYLSMRSRFYGWFPLFLFCSHILLYHCHWYVAYRQHRNYLNSKSEYENSNFDFTTFWIIISL